MECRVTLCLSDYCGHQSVEFSIIRKMKYGKLEGVFPEYHRHTSPSCIPHYHPGLRDFPSPVGSEDLSAWSLPDRQAVQVMVCIRGLLFGLLHASSGWSMRDAPDTVFRSALPLQTVPPRAPWLQRRYPLSSLLRAHRPIPMPPARVSCSALTTSASPPDHDHR
jgi:hypothetical protein